MMAREHAGHRLQRVAETLVTSRFHDRAVDDVDRGRDVKGAQSQAAARIRLLGESELASNHR